MKKASQHAPSTPAILLVEDSPDDAYFFRRALTKGKIACQLTHLSDGAAAIDWLQDVISGRGKLPNLVFLDLKMPVMSGFEVLEWLREQAFSEALPVIVLSGSDEQADRARAKRLGAKDYLVKPIQPEELAGRFRDLCRGEKHLPSQS